MATTEGTALVFTDGAGGCYAVSPELIRHCKVSGAAAEELRAGLAGDDTAGHFTPVPIPFEGRTAATSLSLLGAVQIAQFPSLSSSLEKVGFTPVPIP